MTAAEKRDNTLMEKLIALIRQFPGTRTQAVPQAQRRFLRPMEASGLIEYRNEGWYIKEAE